MIKTRINNEYKDIIKIFGGGPLQKEITKVWSREANKYVYESEVEYTGTLPITINADGTALIDYCIYGNTVQNGTPTPENPVNVVGCGERTENLFDFNSDNPDNGYAYGKQLMPDGSYDTFLQTNVSEYISITPFSSYTFTYGSQYDAVYAALYNTKREFVRSIRYQGRKVITFRSQEDETYLRLSYLRANRSNVYVVEGSTAPESYIPYGYKLPILSNSAVTNIYLGEVETTRRIKKLVLKGTENWEVFQLPSVQQFYINNAGINGVPTSSALSNITPYGVTSNTRYLYDYGCYLINTGTGVAFQMNGKKDTLTDVAAWTSYLAAQYAAGTPVTVWYVLAEPETGIVNEPLMKIGDYTDTLSMEQATVQIPTVAGTTTIDYDGAPKPSQMYIKYRR